MGYSIIQLTNAAFRQIFWLNINFYMSTQYVFNIQSLEEFLKYEANLKMMLHCLDAHAIAKELDALGLRQPPDKV